MKESVIPLVTHLNLDTSIAITRDSDESILLLTYDCDKMDVI